MNRSRTAWVRRTGSWVALAVGATVLSVSAKPVPRAARPGLPSTIAGRRATAFFKAFNSSSDDTMRAFEAEHRAKSALERRSIDERIEQYHGLRADWGDLEVDGVFDSKELELSIGVNAAETDDFLRFRFKLEPDPPNQLVAIYIEMGGPHPVRVRESGPLAASTREETVREIADVLEELYVFPKIGEKMADMLRTNLSAGEYNDATSSNALAVRLSSDLADICHDKHLRVSAGSFPEGHDAEDEEEDDSWWAQKRWKNFGFERVERLPGNVGYLKLNQFSSGKEAEEVAAGAMRFLAGSSALIFDLRENGGGSPDMVAFLAGYLFDESVHLNSFYHRKDDKTTELWSRADVPGKHFGQKKPVYILTSHNTFSGAEGFTYHLKHLQRATVVGETTGGGAHPVYRHRINDSFAVNVPFARAINPITKTNWEGVGVKPNIDVPAGRALLVAQKNALEHILETGPDEEEVRGTKSALRRVTSQLENSAHADRGAPRTRG